MSWFVPQPGGPAPEFEVVEGIAEQNVLLARLLQADFMSIKGDLATGAVTVDHLLQAWTAEFEATNQKKQSPITGRQAQPASQISNQNVAEVIFSEIRPAPANLARVSEVTDKLKILPNAINPANVPDIKIASVELGPMRRWFICFVHLATIKS